ncbi:MAG TPA: hypothetical protein VMB82_01755 [Acidimicrobiales bacterium]|nr:hypothetical protein [Acidimicrobiales bacterium]
MPEPAAGTAVADKGGVTPAPATPPPSGIKRWMRSRAALITLAAIVVAAGLFVGGLALGRATTSTPTSSGTTTPASARGSCSSSNPGQCISFTSDTSDTVRVGARFSFQITTSGPSGIRIRKVGKAPKGVHFTNNHDGTATLAGTVEPARRHSVAGTYPLTFTAAAGSGASRQVVRQDFALIVTG